MLEQSLIFFKVYDTTHAIAKYFTGHKVIHWCRSKTERIVNFRKNFGYLQYVYVSIPKDTVHNYVVEWYGLVKQI